MWLDDSGVGPRLRSNSVLDRLQLSRSGAAGSCHRPRRPHMPTGINGPAESEAFLAGCSCCCCLPAPSCWVLLFLSTEHWQ